MKLLKLKIVGNDFVILFKDFQQHCIGPFSSVAKAQEYVEKYLVCEYKIVPMTKIES